MRLKTSIELIILAFAGSISTWAEIPTVPEGAQVDLYFPHIADGGSAADKWQTAITLLNPSALTVAHGFLNYYRDDGTPLALDFGFGFGSETTFTILPGGTITIRSTATSSGISGWASGGADLPLQATVQFRHLVNGTPQQEVSALATSPALSYVSPANFYTGVAVANIYTAFSVPLNIVLYDSVGKQQATAAVTLSPGGHTSFNIYSVFPGIGSGFSGSLRIQPVTSSLYFVAWTLSVDASGVFSSYPPGPQASPPNHVDRIRDAYYRDLDAAQRLATALGLNAPFNDQAVPLNILDDQILNAYAYRVNNSVNIEIALSELISDAPSELAFVIAHEMGHTIQFRTGALFWVPSNIEYDADQWGMFISLLAGYDPYAAAGALSKLAMASNDASLISQQFDNISGDLHGSFDNRVALVYSSLQTLCATPAGTPFCTSYKNVYHPHFPGNTPLQKQKPVSLPPAPARNK